MRVGRTEGGGVHDAGVGHEAIFAAEKAVLGRHRFEGRTNLGVGGAALAGHGAAIGVSRADVRAIPARYLVETDGRSTLKDRPIDGRITLP